MSEYKIRQLIAPAGEWFYVMPEYLGDKDGYRYVMERVSNWALMESEGLIDHVCPIGDACYPITGDICEDVFHVYGPDKSPTGSTWAEIYHSITPQSRNLIELPQEVATVLNSRWCNERMAETAEAEA